MQNVIAVRIRILFRLHGSALQPASAVYQMPYEERALVVPKPSNYIQCLKSMIRQNNYACFIITCYT